MDPTIKNYIGQEKMREDFKVARRLSGKNFLPKILILRVNKKYILEFAYTLEI